MSWVAKFRRKLCEVMDWQGTLKMSLVAQYDDSWWYTKNLSTRSEEAEFKVFVESVRDCFIKENDTEVRILSEKISMLEAEKRELETQMKHLKNLFEAEVGMRREIQKERKSTERQMVIIRKVLGDCSLHTQTILKFFHLEPIIKTPDLHNEAFIICCTRQTYSNKRPENHTESSGFLSSSDVDDDVLYRERRSKRQRVRHLKGKHSNSGDQISCKRKMTAKFKLPVDCYLPKNCNLSLKAVRARSNSEPTIKSSDIPVIKKLHISET